MQTRQSHRDRPGYNAQKNLIEQAHQIGEKLGFFPTIGFCRLPYRIFLPLPTHFYIWNCCYHPCIEIVDGECHHKARCERYPELHFYYDDQDLDQEEGQVIEDYLYRTAHHFQSKAYRIHKNPTWTLTELRPRSARNKILKPNATERVDKLILYNGNGSPRLHGSNTALILKAISDAYGSNIVIRDLKQKKI